MSRADRCPYRAQLLAYTRRISPSRFRNKHAAHGGRLHSRGISTYRICGDTMIDEKALIETQAPSMAKILTATAIAAAVAVVILVVAVLPAEYGIDPIGTGKALGLMDLANASEKPAPTAHPVAPPATAAEPVADSENAVTIVPILKPAGKAGDAPTVTGAFIEQPNRYKVDSREIKLAPGEGMEIKYHMPKGGGLIYSWTANGKVLFDFHGEPDQKPAGAGEDYYESYNNDQIGKDQSHGTFIAPSTGIHGWFWENQSLQPVTIKLVSAGFYDYITQNLNDVKTRLQPTDPK